MLLQTPLKTDVFVTRQYPEEQRSASLPDAAPPMGQIGQDASPSVTRSWTPSATQPGQGQSHCWPHHDTH